MANEQNLIPNKNRTPEELREMTRKAGIASGKARREKRDRHQRIKDLFALAIENPKYQDMVAKMGIDPSQADLETAMDARVALELLRKGDYKAWEAMKAEAYGKLDNKTSVEVSGEVSGINININRYDKEK